MEKATHGQVREHNRQLVLRSVYTGTATSRAALAQVTGLTKPAISDLVEMLIGEGYLVEEGLGESSGFGGKRPRLLGFIHDARQVIGVCIDQAEGQIVGVLTNLDGAVIATHSVSLSEATASIEGVINGLIAQANAPLLCIGIAQADLDLAKLAKRYRVPVYGASSSELVALALYARKYKFKYSVYKPIERLATIMISDGVSVGAVLEGAGSAHYLGSEIGHLLEPGSSQETLNERFGWQHVNERADALAHQYQSELLTLGIDYLRIRYATAQNDAAAMQLCDELAASVAHICAWVIALLRPEHVAITGTISTLGDAFLNAVLNKLQSPIEKLHFSIDDEPNLAPLGAALRAIQLELGLI